MKKKKKEQAKRNNASRGFRKSASVRIPHGLNVTPLRPLLDVRPKVEVYVLEVRLNHLQINETMRYTLRIYNAIQPKWTNDGITVIDILVSRKGIVTSVSHYFRVL